MVDKPKINLRAWEPIEKRKMNSAKNNSSSKDKINTVDKTNIVTDGFNYQKENREQITNPKRDSLGYDYALKKISNLNEYDDIKQEENGPKYYDPRYIEYKFDRPKRNKPKSTTNLFGFLGNNRTNNKRPTKKNTARRPGLTINSNLIKFLGAGIGAVLTGMIFGYLLLSYIVNPMFDEGISSNNNSNQENINIINESIVDTVNSIPAKTFYLIQAGVFTERNGAETVLSNQKQLGKSAVIAGEGPYYVFVGMANNKGDAVMLKDTLATQNTELYVKEFTLPEYQVNMNNESFSAFNNLLATADQLVFYLAEGSINALVDASYSINHDQIQKQHQQLLTQIQETKPLLSNEQYSKEMETIDNLTENINYAITALNAYKKNSNPQYLWSIQDVLIQYKMELVKLTVN